MMDRNSKDLTEAKEIKKRWEEKKALMEPRLPRCCDDLPSVRYPEV